jgi:hypothetical protein
MYKSIAEYHINSPLLPGQLSYDREQNVAESTTSTPNNNINNTTTLTTKSAVHSVYVFDEVCCTFCLCFPHPLAWQLTAFVNFFKPHCNKNRKNNTMADDPSGSPTVPPAAGREPPLRSSPRLNPPERTREPERTKDQQLRPSPCPSPPEGTARSTGGGQGLFGRGRAGGRGRGTGGAS